MKGLVFWLMACLYAVMTSCTLDKTDLDSETDQEVIEFYDFKEVTSFESLPFKISLEALNGRFYKGYNEVRIKIRNLDTQQYLEESEILGHFTQTTADSIIAGPQSVALTHQSPKNYYSGYVVFTELSKAAEPWNLEVLFQDKGVVYQVRTELSVWEQSNKNLGMTSFEGSDGEQYIIALVAPQKPKVAENKLVAGIFKYNKTLTTSNTNSDSFIPTYTEAENYTLLLDPRMPEPSMGNHSSPNNEDLVQQEDGLYYGVVNYTMTGRWTLNFRLLNPEQEVIRGTVVSPDFTPGIEGTKSELFIDVIL